MYTCKATIIGLCGATLIVSIAYFASVAALHYRNGDDHNNDVHYVNQSQKAIIGLCQNTHYHQTCLDTLSKATNSSDSKTLIAASFKTAIHELGHVIAQTRTLQDAAHDPKTAGAYKTCQKLLEDSIYDLQATIDQITSFDPSDFRLLLDDIKTWLTGALTYQETCLDCFEEVNNNEAGEKMEKLLKLSRELTINGLALVNHFSYFLVPDGLGGARRLFMVHTEKLKDYDYDYDYVGNKLKKGHKSERNLLQDQDHIDYDYDYRGNTLKNGQQSTRNLLQDHQGDNDDYDYGYEGSLKRGKSTNGQQSKRNLLQSHQGDNDDYDYGYEGSLKRGKSTNGQQGTRNLLGAHQGGSDDYDYGYEGSLKRGKLTNGQQSTRNLLDGDYDYGYEGSLKRGKSTKGQQSTRNLLQAHQGDSNDYDYGYEGSLKRGKQTKGQQSTRNLLQAHQGGSDDYDYGYEGSLKRGKSTNSQQSTRNLLQAHQGNSDDYDYGYEGSLKRGISKNGQQSTRNLLQAHLGDSDDYDYGYEGSLKRGKQTKGQQSTRSLLQAHQGVSDDYDYGYEGSLKRGISKNGQQSTRNLLQAHLGDNDDYDYGYEGSLKRGKQTKGQQSTRNLLQAHQGDSDDYDYGYEGSLKRGKSTKGQQSTRNLLEGDYDYGYEGSLKRGKQTKGQQSTRNLLQAHQGDSDDYDYGYEGSLKRGKQTKGQQSTRNLLQAHQGGSDDYDYGYEGSLKRGKSTNGQQSTRNLLQAHQGSSDDYDYGYEGSLKRGKSTNGQQSMRNLLQSHQSDSDDYDYGYEGSLKRGKQTKGQQSTRNLLQAHHGQIDYDYVYDYGGSLIKKGKSKNGQQSTRNLLQFGSASIRPNVVVAKDGSGKYMTINEALLEVPQKSNETFVIYIKEGVYQEYVTVNRTSRSVMFIGDGPTKTKVIGDRSKIGGYDTFWTSTVAIEGDNFIARDMGFENNAGPGKHQAVAVRVSADKTIFHNCQIDGFQDTLYAHNHRQYYRDCTISGTIDFIFGNARAVFQNCTLVVRKPLESQKLCMVTAQGRTLVNQTSALVLQNCKIVAGPDYPVGDKSYEAFLGRPWKQFSRAIVMDSEIDGLINTGGWSAWNGTDAHLDTCWYAEGGNMGAGSDLTGRVKWPGFKRLSIKEAEAFTPEEYFMGDEWIAGKGVPYDSGRRGPIQQQ